MVALGLLLGSPRLAPADEDEFELPPIEYSKSEPHNAASKLQQRLESGEQKLAFDKKLGYLPALLEALKIPVDSQLLVFSKTSMQRSHISPRTPRAIYFNDDVYVGYCQRGEVMEIAAADPQLGAVFYSIDQQDEAQPAMTRQTQTCLQCHGTSPVENIPALVARSLFTDGSGQPLLSEGSRYVDPSTPLEDRWGGWYVTGLAGKQKHLGNLIVQRGDKRPFDNVQGLNVTELGDRFRVANYLSPHSDLVALMVFEHQLQVHNLLTKANFETRRALAYQADLNKALGDPADTPLESTTRRIANAGDKLVEALLFVDEAPLTEPIQGTSGFAESFSKRGPSDEKGRSLREFDLKTRMFKYPCSFLIYSEGFDALPEAVKSYVVRKLEAVLRGEDPSGKFSHLSTADRTAILEILKATKPGLWDEAKP